MSNILGSTAPAPRHSPVPRKTVLSVSDAMRRNRIMPPQQCVDNRAKLDNLRRLIAAADREYRETIAELDRLNNEGRVWLVIDLIHKTALASLDLGASIMSITGHRGADAIRGLADGTQTFSDVWTGAAGVASGETSAGEFTRTLAGRALAHTPARGGGAAHMKGMAELGLSGWGNLENIADAQGTPSAGARTAEGAVDLLGGLVQRSAEAVDTGTTGGSATAKKVGAVAQIARAMASYNRELEGAFNRRLEISGGLMATKATFRSQMERTMSRYRRDAAELERLLASCE